MQFSVSSVSTDTELILDSYNFFSGFQCLQKVQLCQGLFFPLVK